MAPLNAHRSIRATQSFSPDESRTSKDEKPPSSNSNLKDSLVKAFLRAVTPAVVLPTLFISITKNSGSGVFWRTVTENTVSNEEKRNGSAHASPMTR